MTLHGERPAWKANESGKKRLPSSKGEALWRMHLGLSCVLVCLPNILTFARGKRLMLFETSLMSYSCYRITRHTNSNKAWPAENLCAIWYADPSLLLPNLWPFNVGKTANKQKSKAKSTPSDSSSVIKSLFIEREFGKAARVTFQKRPKHDLKPTSPNTSRYP